MSYITDEHKQAIKDIIDASVAKYISELPQHIHKKLTQATLQSIGLSERYGHVEIDHCNGNKGVIGEIVRQRCLDAVERFADTALTEFLNDVTNLTDKIKAGLVREAKEVYNRSVKELIRREAENKAAEDVKAMIQSIENVCTINLGSKSIDIYDPDSFDGHLGEVLLEHTLKKARL